MTHPIRELIGNFGVSLNFLRGQRLFVLAKCFQTAGTVTNKRYRSTSSTQGASSCIESAINFIAEKVQYRVQFYTVCCRSPQSLLFVVTEKPLGKTTAFSPRRECIRRAQWSRETRAEQGPYGVEGGHAYPEYPKNEWLADVVMRELQYKIPAA